MNGERYIRQTILKGFGNTNQEKLAQTKVLVIGAGGLGVPVLTYLNAMGVGTIGIVDNDVVSLSNLHRQVLYDEAEVGQPKVAVAIQKLKAQNPNTELKGYKTFLNKENVLQIIKEYHIVVDATDNFPTRYLINDACVILNKPFVYGALHAYEGQVSLFNYKDGPTYRCLFPDMPAEDEVPNCNEHGVLGILPGIIGNFQALETIKLITGIGEPLSGKLLLYDGLSQTFQKMKFAAIPANLEIKTLRTSYEFSCETPIQTINATDFERLLTIENVQVIDVRTNEEYAIFHLGNTHHIPLSELEKRMDEIHFDESVYMICQSGVRSRKAIAKLQKYQPNATFINVNGGINNLNVNVIRS